MCDVVSVSGDVGSDLAFHLAIVSRMICGRAKSAASSS